MIKYLFRTLLFVLLALPATLFAQISGANPAGNGSTQTYTYDDGNYYQGWVWTATNGKVLTSHENGTAYSVNVQWDTTGSTGVLYLKQEVGDNQFTVIAGQSIALTSCSINPPTVSNLSICGSGIVTITPTVGAGGNTIHWFTTSSILATPFATQTSYAPSLSSTTTYYITTFNTITQCESSPRVAVTVTVTPLPDAPSNPTLQSNCGTAVLASAAPPAGVTWFWQDTNTSGTDANNAAPTYSATTSNTYYIRSRDNISNCWGGSSYYALTVSPVPTLAIAGNNQTIFTNSSATLSANTPSAGSGLWSVVSGPSTLSSQFSSPTNPASQFTPARGAGSYVLIWTISNGTCTPSTSYVTITATSQLAGLDMNYVVTNTALIDNITDPASVDNRPVAQISQTISYFDGLGRPIQNVVHQGSPLKSDIVQPVFYDAFGRESKKYLPFASDTTGWYKSDPVGAISGNYAESAQYLYYNNDLTDKIANDVRPFSETAFESSPLNRPLQQFGPGQDWKVNNKSVGHQYLINKDSEVILFDYDAATGLVSAGVSSQPQHYTAGQLYANVTTDEHNNDVIEFVDKQGHMVCKKVQYKIDETSGSKLYASTYYIYDDFGNLVVVLPPEAVRKLASNQN